jgi:hypothetical protein
VSRDARSGRLLRMPNVLPELILSPDLAQARDTLYPGWWTYAGLADADDDAVLPLYRVEYRTAEERQLAEIAKPAFVNAIFVAVAED